MNRYLTIENPDTSATVDFLSEDVAVEVTIENGKLRIVAKMMHGKTAPQRRNSSSWDEHEVKWPLPRNS
jgi:hypothetical protein